jgi:lysophospholipase L1-like esterase
MTTTPRRRVPRLILLLSTNLLVFFATFAALEVAYRVYRDGFPAGIVHIFSSVPYSNPGTDNPVIFDGELGYRLNPAREKISRLGIKNPEVAIPKPAGVHRIVVLGDSIPWDRPGFVDYVRDDLTGRGSYEVINASVPGYTSFQEVRFFERHLADVAPDLVLWIYCLNDNHKFLHRFDEKANMLLTPEAEASLRINSRWDALVSRSYLLSLLRRRLLGWTASHPTGGHYPWEDIPDFNVAWKDATWPAYEELLRTMRQRLGSARLVVVAVPFEPQLLLRHDSRPEYVRKPQRLLGDLCREHRVPFLDLYPTFSQAYDAGQTLFRDGVHLVEAGHRLASSAILDFLAANRLLAPASEERPR